MTAPAEAPWFFDLTRSELRSLFGAAGIKEVHADAVWGATYRGGNGGRSHAIGMAALPAALQGNGVDRLVSRTLPAATDTRRSADGFTTKDLLRLRDGAEIETVLIRYLGRATACVSTQVGCAMGCVFCASGQMGFARNLTAGEIVAQVVHVDRLLQGTVAAAPPLAAADDPSAHRRHERLRNVVFMGMGEPLLNLDAVLGACEILRDPNGLALAARRLTVSTVGVVPGIHRLARERHPIRLAVSLHAATQEERAAIVPVARRWPLDELLAACRDYVAAVGRRILFEWTLIAGEHDTDGHAHAVGALLRDIPCQVNLIPLNPTAGYPGDPTDRDRARAFQRVLRTYDLPSTVRQRRGIDIAAGCGQLAAGRDA